MKTKYRIYVIGEIPVDLKERIAIIHASGFLKGKSGDAPARIQGLNKRSGKAVHPATGSVRR